MDLHKRLCFAVVLLTLLLASLDSSDPQALAPYCHFMKRVNVSELLRVKTFHLKVSAHFLRDTSDYEEEEELVYNFRKRQQAATTATMPTLDAECLLEEDTIDTGSRPLLANASRIFVFRALADDRLQISLDEHVLNAEQLLRALVNRTVKFVFARDTGDFCSLLVEFYEAASTPHCDQSELADKYLSGTYVSHETTRSQLASGRLLLDLGRFVSGRAQNDHNQTRYSLVCLKCCDARLKLRVVGEMLQVTTTSTEQDFMRESGMDIAHALTL